VTVADLWQARTRYDEDSENLRRSISAEQQKERAMSLIFPQKVLDQHLVVLGKTGAGKSSALRHIVEHLLSHKKRVCVVDPKGDWNGLKVSADGKGAGFPVILFGDFKETAGKQIPPDVPLNEFSGKHIAELVTSGNRPCVIGLRGWTQGHMHKFWIDFASTVFNSNAGELYLVIDEVHNFAPKGKILSPEVGIALHWSNRVMNEGRGIGLVNLIASQRPQKVHNDTLTACETLVAMRVIHKADRDAVEDWIKGCGDPKQGIEVLNALAGMKRGEAYVWSPEVAFGPERLAFPMFTTFDSFAPPQLQTKVSGKDWASVDLDEVKQKLASVIEKAKQNDPKELQKKVSEANKRIGDLERQLTVKAPAPAKTVETIKEVEKPVLKDGHLNRLESVSERLAKVGAQLVDVAKEITAAIQKVSTNGHKPVAQRVSPVPRAVPERKPAPTPVVEREPQTVGDLKINKTQQRILDALAWYESIGIPEPTNIQIGAIALIDPTGGYFSNTVGPLTTAGLVERRAGTMSLTDEGRAVAVVPESIGSLDDYHDVLRQRVRKARSANGRTVDMLNAIIANGVEISTEEIGRAVGIDHTGGYFSNTIGPLSTLGLIERNQGMVRPTDVLFPPGLA
jgi:hypothetical protein